MLEMQKGFAKFFFERPYAESILKHMRKHGCTLVLKVFFGGTTLFLLSYLSPWSTTTKCKTSVYSASRKNRLTKFTYCM